VWELGDWAGNRGGGSDEPQVVGEEVEIDTALRHGDALSEQRPEPELEGKRQKKLAPAEPHRAGNRECARFVVGRRHVHIADAPPFAAVRREPASHGTLSDSVPVASRKRGIRTDREADPDIPLLATQLERL